MNEPVDNLSKMLVNWSRSFKHYLLFPIETYKIYVAIVTFRDQENYIIQKNPYEIYFTFLRNPAE